MAIDTLVLPNSVAAIIISSTHSVRSFCRPMNTKSTCNNGVLATTA